MQSSSLSIGIFKNKENYSNLNIDQSFKSVNKYDKLIEDNKTLAIRLAQA